MFAVIVIFLLFSAVLYCLKYWSNKTSCFYPNTFASQFNNAIQPSFVCHVQIIKLYNTVQYQHNVQDCLAHIIRSVALGAGLLLNNVIGVVRKTQLIVKQIVVFHYSTYTIHKCNYRLTATLYTTLTANVMLYYM